MSLVFTNGCFDIIHVGHIAILKFAWELAWTGMPCSGSVTVGLNSDKSVRELKGNNRPIVSQADRKTILESIHYVNEVIIFDEPTPIELIKDLRPNYIVKGSEYEDRFVIGADLAEVRLVPMIEGYSTTSILKRMK